MRNKKNCQGKELFTFTKVDGAVMVPQVGDLMGLLFVSETVHQPLFNYRNEREHGASSHHWALTSHNGAELRGKSGKRNRRRSGAG